MVKTIEIKNKTNWFAAIVLPFALLILVVIIILILPLFSLRQSLFLSLFAYVGATCLPLTFLTFLLDVWLWNTFGRTVLKISPNELRVRHQFKIFGKPKTYLKSAINDIAILDLSIERTALFTRRNYLFSNANQSIVVITNAGKKDRIIDWLTTDKATELLIKIKTALEIQSQGRIS